jgi:hypothetical protein
MPFSAQKPKRTFLLRIRVPCINHGLFFSSDQVMLLTGDNRARATIKFVSSWLSLPSILRSRLLPPGECQSSSSASRAATTCSTTPLPRASRSPLPRLSRIAWTTTWPTAATRADSWRIPPSLPLTTCGLGMYDIIPRIGHSFPSLFDRSLSKN